MNNEKIQNEEYDIIKKIYTTNGEFDEERMCKKIFDEGFVKLVDCFPRIVPAGRTLEFRAVQSARVSYGKIIGEKMDKNINGLKGVIEDRNLLKYLIRNKHTSPLESISFQFVLKIPIHVKNQLIRHRTGKFNEYSQRYNHVDLGFYEGEIRMQGDTHNKQSSDEKVEIPKEVKELWEEYIESTNKTIEIYDKLVKAGVAREVARSHLPLSTFTIIYFQMDLNNLLKFFNLRLEEGAQKEIRIMTEAMKEIITPLVPDAMSELDNYMGGMTLSKNDVEYMKEIRIKKEIPENYKGSKSEKRELDEKLKVII